MITWAQIILGIIRVLDRLLGYVNAQQLINSGEDRAIAEGIRAVLAKTQAAREIEREVANMPRTAIDDYLLRDARD